MILKALNDKLGPKTITAEGQIQEIGAIVKRKTGKDYRDIPRKKQTEKNKNEPILPRRRNVKEMKETFYSNAQIIKRYEENAGLLERTLSKLEPLEIQRITSEKKTSQKVYRPFSVNKYSNKPLTR